MLGSRAAHPKRRPNYLLVTMKGEQRGQRLLRTADPTGSSPPQDSHREGIVIDANAVVGLLAIVKAESTVTPPMFESTDGDTRSLLAAVIASLTDPIVVATSRVIVEYAIVSLPRAEAALSRFSSSLTRASNFAGLFGS